MTSNTIGPRRIGKTIGARADNPATSPKPPTTFISPPIKPPKPPPPTPDFPSFPPSPTGPGAPSLPSAG